MLSDFLLMGLRKLQQDQGHSSGDERRLRVVCMSATLDPGLYARYFESSQEPGPGVPVKANRRVPLVHITGRTFPVHEIYIEDFASKSIPVKKVAATKALPAVDFPAVVSLVRHIAANQPEGAILVFLPGTQEINRLCSELQNSDKSLLVLPCHSQLPSKDQRKVFAPAAADKRKVVVSTNIAETSITIDDIGYVIDSGKKLRCRVAVHLTRH